MFFEWNKDVFGASFRERIILLILRRDNYSGLDKNASRCIDFVLKNEFSYKNGFFYPISSKSNIDNIALNKVIMKFIDLKIINTTENKTRRNKIAVPKEPGGIAQLEWLTKLDNNDIKPKNLLILKAFFYLCKSHFILKISKINGLIGEINRNKIKTRSAVSSVEQSLVLASALDSACLFFPRNTACLLYAASLLMLHRNQNLECNFVIGVQNAPFYAHAWIEVDNTVINDNPELNKKLAPIVTISNVEK